MMMMSRLIQMSWGHRSVWELAPGQWHGNARSDAVLVSLWSWGLCHYDDDNDGGDPSASVSPLSGSHTTCHSRWYPRFLIMFWFVSNVTLGQLPFPDPAGVSLLYIQTYADLGCHIRVLRSRGPAFGGIQLTLERQKHARGTRRNLGWVIMFGSMNIINLVNIRSMRSRTRRTFMMGRRTSSSLVNCKML